MKTTYFLIVIITLFLAGIPVFGQNAKKDKPAAAKTEKAKKTNQFHEKMMAQLTDEEKAKLRQLQKDDPKSFQQELKELAKKYRLKNAPKTKEVKDLVNQFHETEDENQREEILAKLTKIVRNQFEKKMEANRKNYEKIEKRLEELRAKLEDREDKAEEIILQRVQDLTKDPALAW